MNATMTQLHQPRCEKL